MAEQNLIEQEIKNILEAETQKRALHFADFLRINQLSPVLHESGDGYAIMCKEESIGFIIISGEKNELLIFFNVCDFGSGEAADIATKEFAWSHMSPCNHCGCEQQDYSWTVFGKAFNHCCHSPLAFFNPDSETLNHIKNLFLLLKQNRLRV